MACAPGHRRAAGSPTAECTIVTSSARARSSGGSRPGRRDASIVLPAPGGPMNRVWCPPAAATSSACLAIGWPCTSARSGTAVDASSGGRAGSWSGHGASPRSTSTNSPRLAMRRTRPSAATDASAALAIGTTTSRSPSAPTIGATPFTGRSDPSRPSSPMNANAPIASAGITSLAASTPTAIARSSPEPALRSPDGARLTVILCFGQGWPLLVTAALARSRDSRIDTSGRPTRLKPGKPADTWTSTWIRCPSAQKSTADGTDAYIAHLLGTSRRTAGTSRRDETGPTTPADDVAPAVDRTVPQGCHSPQTRAEAPPKSARRVRQCCPVSRLRTTLTRCSRGVRSARSRSDRDAGSGLRQRRGSER